jgi:hypothetical protein
MRYPYYPVGSKFREDPYILDKATPRKTKRERLVYEEMLR